MTEETKKAFHDIDNLAAYLKNLYKETGKRPYYVFTYNPDNNTCSELCKDSLKIGKEKMAEILNSNEIVAKGYFDGKNEVPKVGADKEGYVLCPYCGQKHRHGNNGNGIAEGMRAADCGKGEYFVEPHPENNGE